MNVPGALHHFALLDREQQAQAIGRMANTGWSDSSIAAATRLSVEQIRRILAGPSRAVADLDMQTLSTSDAAGGHA